MNVGQGHSPEESEKPSEALNGESDKPSQALDGEVCAGHSRKMAAVLSWLIRVLKMASTVRSWPGVAY